MARKSIYDPILKRLRSKDVPPPQAGSPGAATTTSSSGSSAALISKDEGTTLTSTTASLNFVGSGVTATNSGNDVTVTINGGSGSGHTIENSGTPLATESNLNFTSGLKASDDAGNSATKVEIDGPNVPTLNQDTTGTATKATNLKGGNSTTLLGEIPYQSNTDTTTLLAPNTTTTKKFLRQTGDGTNGAAPAWDTIVAGDVPTLNQNTTGSAAKWTTARSLAGNSVDGSADVNFSNKFIVQGTADSGLSSAQFLGALSTGLVKNTTTTGVLSIASAGTDYTTPSDTETMTNKRITPRITSISSSATPTINTDNCDAVTITAQAADITSMTTNLTGTPNNFDKLIIRIKDNGTARAITWGASFVAEGVGLPTTTVISKVLTVGFIYDSVKATWGCVSVAQEA